MDKQTVLIAFIVSNVVGLVFWVVAFKWPKIARIMFALLFGWACWFNYSTCHKQPEAYLMYGEHSIHLYSVFINGWFKDHITAFVTFIAVGQGLIALGMLLKGWWVNLACIGAIIFLLGIAPFGMYSAFPFSLVVSAAAYLIMRNDDKNWLWKFRSKIIE